MCTIKKMLSRSLAFLYLVFFAATASAGFPDRPIEFIIPFGAGGGADIEGRLLAKEMSNILGVPLTPINKPGAGGAITYTYIVNSKPDGYTIGWNSTSVLTTTNLGNTDFDYDAMDHIGRVEYQPQPFVVKADSNWKSFQDFVNDCRSNPNTYKIANSGTGSATHTAAIAIMNAINCKVIHLPKGIKGRNASVLSGEADAMVAPLTGAIRLSKAGKLRILAVPTSKRNMVIPDVPTMGELGYDAELDLFRGLSVAPGTPQSIKDKLFDAMSKAAKSEAFMGLAKKKGFTVDPMGPKAFTALLSNEDNKVKNIFKGAGLYKSK
ncbi:MAG: tripartite tricarboxylate transporter substrate binding protein [SAR324 cluster bacterium]|nr:tripartite tricarboxylate transporter substrate binding protein [SAR324 cluster bacterium]